MKRFVDSVDRFQALLLADEAVPLAVLGAIDEVAALLLDGDEAGSRARPTER